MNSKQPLKSKKISSEVSEKNKPLPYQYQHKYRCWFSNKYGQTNMDYVLHCDYPDPRNSKSITELKHRLSWTYAGCKLDRFTVLGSKKVCSEYLYQIKRSKYEAE
jgi:hypothetical protein